jgi:hypothetical protein
MDRRTGHTRHSARHFGRSATRLYAVEPPMRSAWGGDVARVIADRSGRNRVLLASGNAQRPGGKDDRLLGFPSLEASQLGKLVGSRVQNVERWREKPMLARAKL